MLYIASSLNNSDRVKQLRDIFKNKHDIDLTYDWTTHGFVSDKTKLYDISLKEYHGVIKSACVLMVLPARFGSHFEFGVAYASKIPIVIFRDIIPDNDVSFYHLPGIKIVDTEDDAINTVVSILNS